MNFNPVEILGLIAAVFTTSAFLPQVYKTWRSRSAKNLSLTMYLVFFTGVMMWMVYGFLIDSLAVILANIVTGFLTLILIYFKIRYKD
ncbi:SemiSWEET family sugar transporter [Abyssalbus ytuae]|uniref:SemiSWEET transporter n=1 Tax=Abyssalbus ytuae TaxID=2926907 RepID=A0A9E7CTJ2_9FLAO|nr:SemiSWEET transporter [Abyssalbus ytuae]UOB16272.1 SemiSWEET transporter [Abyssalbus ytuae]